MYWGSISVLKLIDHASFFFTLFSSDRYKIFQMIVSTLICISYFPSYLISKQPLRHLCVSSLLWLILLMFKVFTPRFTPIQALPSPMFSPKLALFLLNLHLLFTVNKMDGSMKSLENKNQQVIQNYPVNIAHNIWIRALNKVDYDVQYR